MGPFDSRKRYPGAGRNFKDWTFLRNEFAYTPNYFCYNPECQSYDALRVAHSNLHLDVVKLRSTSVAVHQSETKYLADENVLFGRLP